jgi:putative ABC transport system ATP-binding protein
MPQGNGQQPDYVVRTEDVHKDLQLGEVTVHAVRGVTLRVERRQFLGIIGPSGSGKSTLLGLIGGLDTPTKGRVWIDGQDITDLGERALTRVRNEKIGFVFQFFNLIPTLTARENVALPAQFARDGGNNPDKRAAELLDMLGLKDRMDHRPAQLSGGEQQRVAIARALSNSPSLILSDEPTGNLDTDSSKIVMDALRHAQQELGTTLVVVSHDLTIVKEADRVVSLVDGQIEQEEARSPEEIASEELQEKPATAEVQNTASS